MLPALNGKSQINQPRWREVFLLVVGMLDSADDLLRLMKQEIDGILANDEKLQKYLICIEQKSDSLQVAYKPASVRAGFCGFDVSGARELARALDHTFDLDSLRDHYLCKTLSRVLHPYDIDIDLPPNNPELSRFLQQLKDIPHPLDNHESYKKWYGENCKLWAEQMRKVMTEWTSFNENWWFNSDQEKLLQQYIKANWLLVDCLKSDCYVSRQVRQDIEDTLLLPIKPNSDKPS